MSPWHVTLVPAAEAELLRIPKDMQARFVHVFIKKTQKTPQKNMAIAQKRLQSLHHG